MSQFMPELSLSQQPSGNADFQQGNPDSLPGDVALMQRVLSAAAKNVNLIPPDFMAYVVDFIQTSRLQIPIGQVFGYPQITPKDGGTVATDESRSASTYSDLTTLGPQLTGLSDGTYEITFGCCAYNPAGVGDARMSIDVNGTGAVDQDAVLHSGGNFSISLSRMVVKTLSAGDANTITAKYKGDGVNASHFLNRWMIAQRVGKA